MHFPCSLAKFPLAYRNPEARKPAHDTFFHRTHHQDLRRPSCRDVCLDAVPRLRNAGLTARVPAFHCSIPVPTGLGNQRVLTGQVGKRREITIGRPKFFNSVVQANRCDAGIMNFWTFDFPRNCLSGECFEIARSFAQ